MKYFRQGLFISLLSLPAIGAAVSDNSEFNEKTDPVVIVTNPVESMKRITESTKVTGWTLSYVIEKKGNVSISFHQNEFFNKESCEKTAMVSLVKIGSALPIGYKISSVCSPIYDVREITNILYQRVK
jgi:hypothetical protein